MAYVEQSDIYSEIPQTLATQALDDNEDGAVDASVWTTIQTQVQNEIDGLMAGRYAVPFVSPIPPLILHAALIFACEKVISRRLGKGEKNPFTKQADELRGLLKKIAIGEAALAVDIPRAKPPISIISEDSRLHSASGYAMV